MTVVQRVGTADMVDRVFNVPRVIRRTVASFPVRRIGNDYADQTLDDMCPGHPAVTDLLAGISTFFPPGERFMIASAMSIRDQIEDPLLLAEIDAFVRQEAQHASEHSRLNQHIAADVGMAAEEICREIDALWQFVERNASPRVRAGVTAATEHFTGFIAEVLLRDIEFIDSIPDGKAKQLFVWHAIEECEHKAVVFDAYKEVGGSELERIAIMAAYSVPVFLAASLPVLRLLAGHGRLRKVETWADAVRVVGGRWGWPLLRGYTQYYRPGFHPNHLPTRELELFWRDRLSIVDDGKRTA
ncbi:metal-dependent hydrolase [Nocardioides salsibiostraticola]